MKILTKTFMALTMGLMIAGSGVSLASNAKLNNSTISGVKGMVCSDNDDCKADPGPSYRCIKCEPNCAYGDCRCGLDSSACKPPSRRMEVSAK